MGKIKKGKKDEGLIDYFLKLDKQIGYSSRKFSEVQKVKQKSKKIKKKHILNKGNKKIKKKM